MDSTRFRGGAQSGSHRSVSTPCPPNRTCGFPASGSPVGSCLSHAERRCGSRSRYRRLCVPPAARSCTASPARCPLPSRRRACSRPGGTKPIRPGPFAYACDASQLSAPACGVHRRCHSRGLSFLRHLSTPEAPFLRGRYPASSVLRGLSATLPAQPAPRGVPVAACTAPAGLPVLLRLPSSMRADANTPAETGRCVRRSLPDRPSAFPYLQEGRLPHYPFRGLLGVHSRSGPHGR